MKVYKHARFLKLLFMLMITFLYCGQLQRIEASDLDLLETEMEQTYQGGRIEYIFEDVSDQKDTIPVYGEAVISFFTSAYSLDENDLLYGYSTLTATQKALYNKFDTAFTQFMNGDYKTKDYAITGNFIVPFQVQESGVADNDLLKVYFTYRHDHPEYYWISLYYSFANGAVFVTMDNSYAKASDRLAYENLITEGIKPYLEEASKQNDEYDKVRMVHDMIIDAVDYAYDRSGKPESSIWAHNVIGLFNGNGVVCEGYAKAFQLILNKLGIQSVYVIGSAGEAHAWNYVCIDNKYYAIDVTWDDLGREHSNKGGIQYQYFCMPGTYFKASHTPYSSSGDPKSGKWLYTLPTLENGNEYTYYQKYNAIATGITSLEAAKTFVDNAKAAAVGDYVRIISDNTSASFVASALGVQSYLVIKNYGNYKALFIEENYNVKYPATSIAILPTELSSTELQELQIDRSAITEDIYLEVILNNNEVCDDRISWTTSNGVVKIIGSGTKVKIIPKRNGIVTVTAKAAVGKISTSCTIRVFGGAESEYIYQDAGFTQTISEDDIVIWVNGGNVKTGNGNEKINYKQTMLYTDMVASDIVTVTKGRTSTKQGKLIVGVTLSSEEPTLIKNKIVDAEAAKIAKASIKNGVITVKAQKQEGMVYVWVYDTGDEKLIGYAPITVKTAPNKIMILENPTDTKAFKKITLPIDAISSIYLQPMIGKNAVFNLESTYTVAPDAKSIGYVNVSKIGTEFIITPLALKDNKSTKLKLVATCDQNAKKTTLSITINNPVRSLAPTSTGQSFAKKNDVITITLNETTASTSYATTMKPVVYVMTEPNLTLDSKNKLTGTKASDIAVKLASDRKSFTLTLKKDPNAITSNHHIYVLYKEGSQYELFYLGYVDKSDLALKLE